MDEKEGERRLRVPYSKLEGDIANCLQGILSEHGIELTQEELHKYSSKAVQEIWSSLNSSVYAGLVLIGMELASKMVEEDYKLEQK